MRKRVGVKGYILDFPHDDWIFVSLEGVAMNYTVECEQEDDGRWLAEVTELPGVMVYGLTCDEAIAKVEALALRVLAERLENGETRGSHFTVSFAAA